MRPLPISKPQTIQEEIQARVRAVLASATGYHASCAGIQNRKIPPLGRISSKLTEIAQLSLLIQQQGQKLSVQEREPLTQDLQKAFDLLNAAKLLIAGLIVDEALGE